MSFHVINTKVEWLAETKRPAEGSILVIPANDHLWMSAGPGLEIKVASGKELELEAVRQGPASPGAVIETIGGASGFARLFHAVVWTQNNQWSPGAGRIAGRAMIEAAERAKSESLVAYPFHRGAHAPQGPAIQEMLAGLLEALERGSTVRRVTVLMADAQEQALFQQAFLQALSGRT
ncbi:MAG: hypothetical protein U0527_02370 [Candidatus Eisenbacteria bacterium]